MYVFDSRLAHTHCEAAAELIYAQTALLFCAELIQLAVHPVACELQTASLRVRKQVHVVIVDGVTVPTHAELGQVTLHPVSHTFHNSLADVEYVRSRSAVLYAWLLPEDPVDVGDVLAGLYGEVEECVVHVQAPYVYALAVEDALQREGCAYAARIEHRVDGFPAAFVDVLRVGLAVEKEHVPEYEGTGWKYSNLGAAEFAVKLVGESVNGFAGEPGLHLGGLHCKHKAHHRDYQQSGQPCKNI